MSTNYTDRLRRLAVNDAITTDGSLDGGLDSVELDEKTLALARLAALVAVGGAGPSFGDHTDAAVSAGASADEIVDVLVGVAPVVGVPRVVEAAPKLALALGHDLEVATD